MKIAIIAMMFFCLVPLFCVGQEPNSGKIDSVLIHSDSPTEQLLRFLENCDSASVIANRDIQDHKIRIFIVGGISPVVFSSDIDFESQYEVTYFDFGDVPANTVCMRIYNETVFNFLTEKYGKSWKKAVRKDAFGFKEWKRRK